MLRYGLYVEFQLRNQTPGPNRDNKPNKLSTNEGKNNKNNKQTNKQTNGFAFWNSENKMRVTGFQREHYTHICSTYNTIYFVEDSHLINMVLDLLLRRIHIGSDDPDVGISSRNLQKPRK